MLLTPQVVADIEKIIADHHELVAAVFFGADTVSPEVWDQAVKLGLVDPTDPTSLAELLHLYGAYMAHVGGTTGTKHAAISLDQFRDILKRDKIPQTDQEQASAAFIRHKNANAVLGLGRKAASRSVDVLHDHNLRADQEMREVARNVLGAKFGDEVAQARVEAAGAAQGLGRGFFKGIFRETIGRAVSDIGHLTGAWRKDLQRIVQTAAHTTIQEGQQDRWQAAEEEYAREQRRPVDEVYVYKLPRPQACEHCLRLHLDGAYPRIYTLTEAQGNGTNQGRKARDWKFVVGSVHPWCGCPLFKVPSFVALPDTWRSGESAPSVVGEFGRIA